MNKFMSRPEMVADYIINENSTIRKTAKHFSLSKSTIHLDVTKRLIKINPYKYLEVKKVLDKNFKEKNIRGGYSTKIKFLELKNKKTTIN